MQTVVTRERDTRPGAWVKAAMDARGLNEAEVAVRTRRDPSTIHRWKRSGLDFIAWIGLLNLLGLPATWEPGAAVPKLPREWQPGDPVPPAPKPQ